MDFAASCCGQGWSPGSGTRHRATPSSRGTTNRGLLAPAAPTDQRYDTRRRTDSHPDDDDDAAAAAGDADDDDDEPS